MAAIHKQLFSPVNDLLNHSARSPGCCKKHTTLEMVCLKEGV